MDLVGSLRGRWREGEIAYPVFVKPAKGSASININKVTCREEVELLCRHNDDMMIQEYMDGTEYGADVYVDMLTGKVTPIFVKEKVKNARRRNG